MRNKTNSVPSGTPAAPNEISTGIKSSKKKCYALAVVITIAVVATALLIPQGLGNSIPLSLDYQVGEKMIYNTTEQVEQNENSGNITSTSSLEVVDFDGEYYTLNHTITTILESPFTVSFIEKVNKTGYASYFIPGETENLFGNTSSNPVLAALLSKPEAKVGDTWQIPLATGNSTIGTTGNLTLTFGNIEDFTVPAGTYRVFRIDIASNDLTAYSKIPGNNSIPEASEDITTSIINVSFSGHIYLEYGTCRQIKSDVQIAMALQSELLNSNINYSSHMTLTQHIKP
jgi:hypothetical protein